MLRKAARLVAISCFAFLLICLAFPVFAVELSDFEDLEPGAWYEEAVSYALEENLFQGSTETLFRPDLPMTRAMLLTVLGRYAQVDTSPYRLLAFYDVSPSAYYGPYAAWAKAVGLSNGTSSNRFSPDELITREQVVTLLYRFASLSGNSTGYNTEAYETYLDTDQVSSYAQVPMQWAVSHNIIQGRDGLLAPAQTATRAQLAQLFYNIKDFMENRDIPYQELQPLPPLPNWNPKSLPGFFKISRETVVRELTAHSHDNFYLGTPYRGGYWKTPFGVTSSYGNSGMNCAGFVAAVMERCGMAETAFNAALRNDSVLGGSSVCAASSWRRLCERYDLLTYSFPSKEAMLRSGKLKKGDIILIWEGYPHQLSGEDNHIGIFWGNTPGEDKFWHSVGIANHMSGISEHEPPTTYMILPLD